MTDPMIDIAYLKQLFEIFDASTVHDLRIEREGVEIRLSKSPRREEPATLHYAPMPAVPAAPPVHEAPAATSAPAPTSAPSTAEPAAAPAAPTGHEIRSPIVGTFYRSPNPDSDPFVSVGSRVKKGSVLCIVEAMKLMNEIECDVDGVVAHIYAENGQPVEYGQLLFVIDQD